MAKRVPAESVHAESLSGPCAHRRLLWFAPRAVPLGTVCLDPPRNRSRLQREICGDRAQWTDVTAQMRGWIPSLQLDSRGVGNPEQIPRCARYRAPTERQPLSGELTARNAAGRCRGLCECGRRPTEHCQDERKRHARRTDATIVVSPRDNPANENLRERAGQQRAVRMCWGAVIITAR